MRIIRLIEIVRALVRYLIHKLLPQHMLPVGIRYFLVLFSWTTSAEHTDLTAGQRIRLLCLELGPLFVKFAQSMSTRPDIFSKDMIEALATLRDQVPLESTDVEISKRIEAVLGLPIQSVFNALDEISLGAASIAQVHAATLLDGTEVVVKLLRPGAAEQLRSDVALMKLLASWIEGYTQDGKRLRVQELVDDYECLIEHELDLSREAGNASQLRRNFKDSTKLYVPQMHWSYVRKDLIVMERVRGIPISDRETMSRANINFKYLAESGVEVFLMQVFRDGFFHADMHPGNIFVCPKRPDTPSYIAIDCGIVGSLQEADQRYLAQTLMAFFQKDYQRITELHIEHGWLPADVNTVGFTSMIRSVCEPLFNQPLSQLSFGRLLLDIFNAGRQFKMLIQPRLVLLQKTLLNIEGLGRQLYPELNIWSVAEPYCQRWLCQQIHPGKYFQQLKQQWPFILQQMPKMPGLLQQSLINTQLARVEHREQLSIIHKQLRQNMHSQQALFCCFIALSLMILLWLDMVQNGCFAVMALILFCLAVYLWLGRSIGR